MHQISVVSAKCEGSSAQFDGTILLEMPTSVARLHDLHFPLLSRADVFTVWTRGTYCLSTRRSIAGDHLATALHLAIKNISADLICLTWGCIRPETQLRADLFGGC